MDETYEPPLSPDHGPTGHESGRRVPIGSFDYSVFDVPIDVAEREAAVARREQRLRIFVETLLDFIQGGHGDNSSYKLRALAVAWCADGRHSGTTQAAFARKHGLSKQNFARSVADFRRRFGWKDRRFYSPKAQLAALEREARKREQKQRGA